MPEETPEQKVAREAEEAKAAADEAAKKEAEAKDAASKSSLNGMTEDQIKALETQTGFNRQQLVTMGVMNQQALVSNPQVLEVLEDRVLEKSKAQLKAAGVEAPEKYEAAVRERLKKLSPAERTNAVLVENVFWIEKGKENAKAAPVTTTSKVMKTGTDAGAAADHEDKETKDLSSLSEMEQYVAQRSGIKTLEEWNRYKDKKINTDYEKNWKPGFGAR